jgi:hypothetical protein
MELRRISSRCSIVNFGVSPDAIVEHLNVIKDYEFGFLSGCKPVMMQTLSLEHSKETLHSALSQQLPRLLIKVVMP